MVQRGAVLNGRDIGTVVFPDADVKFFLTAEPDARAQRRFIEEQTAQSEASYEATYADMVERDQRDSNRTDSPLAIAEDAIVVDSTGLSIDEVFQQMMERIKTRAGASPPS